MKTDHLELSPIYIIKKEFTNAHVLITSLAYSIIQVITHAWKELDISVEQGIKLLDKICYQELNPNTLQNKYITPMPDNDSQLLLDALNIKLAVRSKNVPLKKTQ